MHETSMAVHFHRTAFPEAVAEDLRLSLHHRQVNPKFHYDSYKQTARWLELHERCSPARLDPWVVAAYEQAGQAATRVLQRSPGWLIGLGCGGGHKDVAILQRLRQGGQAAGYLAVDASAPMVMCASLAASGQARERRALVCDLGQAEAGELAELLGALTSGTGARLVTFFGMLPNFEPGEVLPLLQRLVRPGDVLLVSANLAPGTDYARGVRSVLPQYDNEWTRRWLLTFLADLGVEQEDGRLLFDVEEAASGQAGGGGGLLRICAHYEFLRPVRLRVGEDVHALEPGGRLRLFFSYRYTVSRLEGMLAGCGLCVEQRWLAAGGEEGVFLCRRH